MAAQEVERDVAKTTEALRQILNGRRWVQL